VPCRAVPFLFLKINLEVLSLLDCHFTIYFILHFLGAPLAPLLYKDSIFLFVAVCCESMRCEYSIEFKIIE